MADRTDYTYLSDTRIQCVQCENTMAIKDRDDIPLKCNSCGYRFIAEKLPDLTANIDRVLVLSIKHMPCPRPTFHKIRVEKHKHGYMLFLKTFDNEAQWIPWLKPIVELALKNACSYIDFDKSAPVIEGLPTPEWRYI